MKTASQLDLLRSVDEPTVVYVRGPASISWTGSESSFSSTLVDELLGRDSSDAEDDDREMRAWAELARKTSAKWAKENPF